MKNTLIKYLVLAFSVIAIFGSCRKDAYEGTQTGDNGKSFVRLMEAPKRSFFFDAFTNVKTITLFSLKRDAANSSELNKSISVSLKNLGQAYLDAKYPSDGYVALPANLYTLSGDFEKTSDGFKVNFPAGTEFQKFVVNVDGSKVVEPKYAIALAISDASGLTGKVGKDTIVVSIGIKNKYDGEYTVTGSFSDKINAGWTGYYPYTANLETLSSTESDVFNVDLDNYGFLFNLNDGSGNQSYYGSFSPQFKFDANDKVIAVVNGYGQLSGGNLRSAELDPTGVNAYDPSTKTIRVKYIMTQSVTGSKVTRATFDEVYKYVGPRN